MATILIAFPSPGRRGGCDGRARRGTAHQVEQADVESKKSFSQGPGRAAVDRLVKRDQVGVHQMTEYNSQTHTRARPGEPPDQREGQQQQPLDEGKGKTPNPIQSRFPTTGLVQFEELSLEASSFDLCSFAASSGDRRLSRRGEPPPLIPRYSFPVNVISLLYPTFSKVGQPKSLLPSGTRRTRIEIGLRSAGPRVMIGRDRQLYTPGDGHEMRLSLDR